MRFYKFFIMLALCIYCVGCKDDIVGPGPVGWYGPAIYIVDGDNNDMLSPETPGTLYGSEISFSDGKTGGILDWNGSGFLFGGDDQFLDDRLLIGYHSIIEYPDLYGYTPGYNAIDLMWFLDPSYSVNWDVELHLVHIGKSYRIEYGYSSTGGETAKLNGKFVKREDNPDFECHGAIPIVIRIENE